MPADPPSIPVRLSPASPTAVLRGLRCGNFTTYVGDRALFRMRFAPSEEKSNMHEHPIRSEATNVWSSDAARSAIGLPGSVSRRDRKACSTASVNENP